MAIVSLATLKNYFLTHKVPTQSQYGDLVDTLGQLLSADGSLPYKKYVALLYQSGTFAPTAVILENTLGFTPSFSYNSAGSYLITHTNGFPIGKTVILSSQSTTGYFVKFDHENTGDASNIGISTTNANPGTSVNDVLLGTSIEIRVYP